ENKDKIKENAVRIINSAYEKRKSEKERLSYTSYLYAALMTIMIFIGIATLYQVYKDTSFFYEKNITWTTAIFYLLKNFFLLAGYIVAIRFLAQFSDKYFKAAQEEENRIHNMTYGKFYVETYASVVDTEEIKEALSDWRTKPSKSEEETSSTTSNVEANSSMPQFSNKDLKEVLPQIDSLLQRIKPAIDKSDKDSNISK
ncbi:hypothetical protein, partial [Vibrio hepatarius]|uniref:hypothetical protein n=1 Tax=Vibrio hepatarius TaxID=171383 RepID=UPI002FD9704C